MRWLPYSVRLPSGTLEEHYNNMFFNFRDAEQFKEASGYEIDGIWYPRVTKIVEIKSKPALYRYYAEAASFKDAMASTEKSATEGTLIHETVEKILLGGEPDVDASIAPAITAFKAFFSKNRIQTDPEYVEKRVVNPEHRYAGTTDALALIGGKFGVLDIKTSSAIYRDYNLQTSAYMDALARTMDALQTRWILRIDQIKTCAQCGATLRPKGGREKVRLPYPRRGPVCNTDEHAWGDLAGVIELKEFPFWKEDFAAFLGAKKLWEWENEYWLKKIGYVR